MKFTKVMSGYYRCGKWEIEKLDGAWIVRKGSLFPEHSTWATTLGEAKQYIARIEGEAK